MVRPARTLLQQPLAVVHACHSSYDSRNGCSCRSIHTGTRFGDHLDRRSLAFFGGPVSDIRRRQQRQPGVGGALAQQRAMCSQSGGDPDHYGQLGIDKSASKSDVKKAYYKLAKKYHPDTNAGDPAAAKKFATLTEAYEVLSDGEKRKLYDTYGSSMGEERGGFGGPGGGFGGFRQGQQMSPEDIFNVFEQAFGGGINFGRQRALAAASSRTAPRPAARLDL